MSNQFGASVKIDGEKEFKAALNEINSGLRVNASELQKITAQYATNGNSVEALARKNEALDKSILSQQDKVNKLREALDAAAKNYGESDQRTMAWQTSLNKAESELYKMNDQLGENEKALDKVNSGTTSVSDAIKGLANAAGIDIPPAMQGMVDKLDNVSASGAALVGVLGGVVTALAKTTIETSKAADDIMTLSSTSGMSTDQIQELSYASELLDVSVDTVDGSITKMIRSMESSKTKTSDQAKAFKDLGVSVKDSHGNLRDANDVFLKTIDALGKVNNETERDALSMTIFGKSARELNPLIEAGSGKLKELSAEAHNVGYVMGGDTLEAFGQLDDAMQRLDKQGDALKNGFAVALLPILTALAEAFGKIPVPVLQTTIVLAGIITTIILAVKAIKEMTGTGNSIVKFFTTAEGKADTTKLAILGVVAALVALGVIIAVIMGKTNDLQTAMGSVGDSVSKISNNVNAASTANAYQRIPSYAKNARGTNYWQGGRTLVGEEGPEIVDLPRGSRIYPNGVSPSGGDVYNFSGPIVIDAKNVKEFNDIVKLAKQKGQMMVQMH